MYAADLVVWLLNLLLEGDRGQTYNVSSDVAIRSGDLVTPDNPVEILGKAANADVNPVSNTYIPNITLARNTLGLDVWTDLSSAIRSTARHAANQMTDEESKEGLQRSIR